MANKDHVALLTEGDYIRWRDENPELDAWNRWRDENPDVRPDLRGADLQRAMLRKANLSRAYLRKANLAFADLRGADLSGADLREANLNFANLGISEWKLDKANLTVEETVGTNLTRVNLSEAEVHKANLQTAKLIEAKLRKVNLSEADLIGADLSRADLTKANLSGALLTQANLSEAILRGTDLTVATLVETNFTGADLTGCRIYGISAWDLTLQKTRQHDLVITHQEQMEITVDNIEVAQFIYLMLHNKKIRDVIETITSKAVLILGRFTGERKAVLDALREELRKRDYLPILFDFEKPLSRNTDETVTLLARMAKFIIADISDAKSVLQELRAIVPNLPSLPVQPIILATQDEPGMFDFYKNMSSFLKVHRYTDQQQLVADLDDKVIHPAEIKVRELRG